jgi:hypothetical protein
LDEQQKRAVELIVLYKKSVAPAKDEDLLVRTGLVTRADFIEALACESDASRIADLKLWLERLEPHWRNQPKMTFVEAQALWETDQRQSPQADETSPQKPSVERGELQVSVLQLAAEADFAGRLRRRRSQGTARGGRSSCRGSRSGASSPFNPARCPSPAPSDTRKAVAGFSG